METDVIYVIAMAIMLIAHLAVFFAVGGIKVLQRKEYHFTKAQYISNWVQLVLSLMVETLCIPALLGCFGEWAVISAQIITWICFAGCVLYIIADLFYRRVMGESLIDHAKDSFELTKMIKESDGLTMYK